MLCLIPWRANGPEGSPGVVPGLPVGLGRRHFGHHLIGQAGKLTPREGRAAQGRGKCHRSESGWTSGRGGNTCRLAHSQNRASQARPPWSRLRWGPRHLGLLSGSLWAQRRTRSCLFWAPGPSVGSPVGPFSMCPTELCLVYQLAAGMGCPSSGWRPGHHRRAERAGEPLCPQHRHLPRPRALMTLRSS